MTTKPRRVPMSNVDKAWLEMDSATNLMIINGVMLFDDVLDFEELKSILAERFVAKYERFHQRIVEGPGGRLYWEDDPHFDIRAHVRRYALPHPGDIATLQTVVSAIINEPLDRRKPLWRYMLIENVEGGSAILARLHHCIGDGIALIKVLLNMTGATPAESLQVLNAPPPTRPPASNPLLQLFSVADGAVKTAVRAVQGVANETLQTLEDPTHPLSLLRSAGIVSAASAAILAKLVILPPDRNSVFKGDLGAIKRVLWSHPFPLERIKEIGRAHGATINDILVAAVAGGLRRYMIEVGDDTSAGDITAMVPVNLRPEGDTSLGNEFALVYLSLPVSLADAYDRLMLTKRHMDVLKNSPEPFLVYQILGVIGTLPGDVAKPATTWFAAKASAVLTNVPGPRQQIYFAGLPLKDLMFWVPQSGNIGLGISVISYNGKVMLGLMVDEHLVRNPQQIINGFELELLELESRLLPGPRSSSSREADGGELLSAGDHALFEGSELDL
jgi:diacylglycerol O-acyltransferase